MPKCPYTEICRAEALKDFEQFPELIAVFQQRTQCSEQNEQRALRCATRLGLTEKPLPALGSYIQEQRRSQRITQSALAQQVGVDIQTLRNLENNKLPSSSISQSLLEGLGKALSTSVEYLKSLVRDATTPAPSRMGAVFTRITPPSDEAKEE
jgi:Predicted transcriptional regulators